MNREFINLLTAYLIGWKTIVDINEWISSVDWDDLNSEAQNTIGRFELLVTEVLEGLREESEFSQEAMEYVAEITGVVYSNSFQELRIADSSNDAVVNSSGIILSLILQEQS